MCPRVFKNTLSKSRVIKMLITSERTWVIFPFAIWWNIFYLNFRNFFVFCQRLRFSFLISSYHLFNFSRFLFVVLFSSSGWELKLLVWVDTTRSRQKTDTPRVRRHRKKYFTYFGWVNKKRYFFMCARNKNRKYTRSFYISLSSWVHF